LLQKYLCEKADDAFSLPTRLLLLFGCNIGCRCQALYNLEFEHIVEKQNEDLQITIDFAQKHDQGAKGQTWQVKKNPADSRICATTLFRKYKEIAAQAKLDSGFLWKKLYMVRGEIRMKNMRLGENWVSGVPKLVASYLALPNVAEYSRHSLRRTCATWHADSGASDQEMRIHFGWRNTSMALVYTANSEEARSTAATRTLIQSQNTVQALSINSIGSHSRDLDTTHSLQNKNAVAPKAVVVRVHQSITPPAIPYNRLLIKINIRKRS
jgi:integrase